MAKSSADGQQQVEQQEPLLVSPMAEQPSATAEQPSATAEQPSVTAEQPSATAEQPSAIAEPVFVSSPIADGGVDAAVPNGPLVKDAANDRAAQPAAGSANDNTTLNGRSVQHICYF